MPKTPSALMQAARGFPGTQIPGVRDYTNFCFGIGMTAQVSVVTVCDASIRQTVRLHAVGSFFYNTVIMALAVNVALALAP